MNKKTTICITGGSGFVGRHLVRRLLEAKYERITILDRNEPPKDVLERVTHLKADFSDAKVLEFALESGGVVIHLAGTSNQATSEKDPTTDAEISIVGSLRLLDVAARKRISKIIFLSSAPAVYGLPKRIPVEINDSPEPRSAYGIMKLALEHYIRHYAEKHDFAYVILRSANAYGPGQLASTHGVVSRFAYNILNDKPLEIWGSPKITRDFLYIDDLVAAIVAALNDKVKKGVFNIASGKGTSLSALIRAIEKAAKKKGKIKKMPMRSIDVPRLYFSVAKAKKRLGWSPKVALHDGIRKTVQWIYDTHPELH